MDLVVQLRVNWRGGTLGEESLLGRNRCIELIGKRLVFRLLTCV